MATVSEIASEARKLMALQKRQLGQGHVVRADRTREKLCDLLCASVTEHGTAVGMSEDEVQTIVAPKDDD